MRLKKNSKEPNVPTDWYVDDENEDSNPISYPYSCPYCGCSHNTHKIQKFRSPQWTWEHLCGRSGYLIICGNCERKIESVITIMN